MGVLKIFSASVLLRVMRLLLNVLIIGSLGRYLGEQSTGSLLSALAVVTVLLCVAELGLARISVREQVAQPDERAAIRGSIFRLRFAAGLLLFGAVVLGSLGLDEQDRTLLWIYSLLLPTHAFAEFGGALEADHQVLKNQWAQWWGFLIGALITLGGVLLQMPLIFFPCAFLAECWITSFRQWLAFRRSTDTFGFWRWDKSRALTLLRESWPELASQLALVLLFRLDTLMLKAMRGDADAGVYAAAVRLSETLYFTPMLLASVLLPRLVKARQSGSGSYETGLVRYFAGSWLMGIGGAVCLVACAVPVTHLLWGQKFAGSADILFVHAWAFIPYALGVARTQHLTIEGRLWANLPSVLLALLTNIVLNWLWIPAYGGAGAAWATLVSYSLAWVATSFLLPPLHASGRLQILGMKYLPVLPREVCDAIFKTHPV